MRYKVSTETTKSQVVKRIIVGVDMGGSLWATAIHNIETNQDSYYGLKDRDGKRKEDLLYNLVQEYVQRGYAVDVFYEAGRYGFSSKNCGCRFSPSRCVSRLYDVSF